MCVLAVRLNEHIKYYKMKIIVDTSVRSLVLENRLGSTVAELYIKEGQEYVEL